MNVTSRASTGLALLVFAVLTGVLGMHGLPAHGALAGPAAMAGTHAGHHQPGDGKSGGHHERGPVCEAPGLGGPAFGHDVSHALQWPVIEQHVLAATTAGAQVEGGGRSPPDPITLSVLRI